MEENKPQTTEHDDILKQIDWATLTLIALFSFSMIFVVAAIYSFNMPVPDGAPIPKAPDYLAFWAAGRMALDGQALQTYDLAAHAAVEAEGIGRSVGVLPWLNPPPFLLLVAPLAFVPFMASHYVWVYLCAVLFGSTAYRIIPHRNAFLGVLIFPVVFFCLSVGQTGLLTGALLAFFVIFMDRNPVIAGFFAGMMVIKPQLAVLIPFILIATGRWKCLLSTFLSALSLCAISTLLFGIDIWGVFFKALTDYGTLASTESHFLIRLQSIYGFLVFAGLPTSLALIIQSLFSVLFICGAVYVWRKPFTIEVKSAVFILLSMMITPYIQIYEFPIIAIAGVFMWRRGLQNGFLPYEQLSIVAFASLFLLLFPLFGPFTLNMPVWGIILFGAGAIIIRRLRVEYKSIRTH